MRQEEICRMTWHKGWKMLKRYTKLTPEHVHIAGVGDTRLFKLRH